MILARPAFTRILVTGATGFIGSEAVNECLRLGMEVHACSRKPPAVHDTRAGLIWHAIDLLHESPASLLSAVKPSHCLHLAWEATPGRYRTDPANYDWAAATIRLARAVYEAGGNSFVLAGSCMQYALPADICEESSHRTANDCAYAVCKSRAAELIASLARDCGARFASGRIFYAYGPGEPEGKLISSICRGLARGEAVPLTTGEDEVDYIFHSDVAKALVALTLSDVAGVVNIGSGEAVRVRDLALRLGTIAGRPDLLEFGKIPLNRKPVRIVAATDRLTGEVGYIPTVTLEEGLRLCYDDRLARGVRHR